MPPSITRGSLARPAGRYSSPSSPLPLSEAASRALCQRKGALRATSHITRISCSICGFSNAPFNALTIHRPRISALNRSLALLASLVGFALIAFAGVACGSDKPSVASPADGVTAVTRQLVVSDEPATAPGEQLGLSRVIIPAGVKLDPHTHPGPQLSLITEGTLTYTVFQGQATVFRDAAGPDPKKEVITAGQTVEIHTGDSLLEPAGIVHTGRNDGKTPVVLYSTSLFTDGAPASTLATP